MMLGKGDVDGWAPIVVMHGRRPVSPLLNRVVAFAIDH